MDAASFKRSAPAPLTEGVPLCVNHIGGLIGATANEWSDPQKIPDDYTDDRFTIVEFAAVEIMLGYRLNLDRGHFELGPSITRYPFNCWSYGIARL